MQVLSYNIREGGEGRLDLISQVIRHEDPDVVALLEAADRSKVEWLARSLSMHVVFGEANNKQGHIAWLSRFLPTRSCNHRHPGLAKTLLEMEVRVDTTPVILFATHLGSRWDVPQPVDEIPVILDVLRARPSIKGAR